MCFKKNLSLLLLCAVTSAINHSYASSLPPNLMKAESHKPHKAVSREQQQVTQSKILKQYSRWKGTHYRFGGHSHRGIDCSALMQEIFHNAVSVGLPRTTGEQIHNGYRVGKDQLKPGDLVFFKTSPKTRHVGVYVGNNEFIHASKIKGVTISNLNSRFWETHYETSRRILKDV